MLCAGSAAFLAFHNKEGWGWFLLVSVLCSAYIKPQKNNETK